MGSIARRRIAGKTAWRNAMVRVLRAEAFAWIEAVTALYKLGRFSSREQALELLFTKVTKADLKEFRRTKELESVLDSPS